MGDLHLDRFCICFGMQRRTGKGVAHISPPLPPSRMGSLSDKPSSRLSQKTLGVTNRIWLILAVFLALIVFTRSVLPSDSSYYPRHKLLHIDAKPRNYLNASDSSAVPFSFCPALGPADALADKYDPVVLAKTRLHTGSGSRIQRVITRALQGLPVTISVIGGSGECSVWFSVHRRVFCQAGLGGFWFTHCASARKQIPHSPVFATIDKYAVSHTMTARTLTSV